MKVTFFATLLLLGCVAALEKHQLDRMKALYDEFRGEEEAKNPNMPARSDRQTNPFSTPECIGATGQLLIKCPFDFQALVAFYSNPNGSSISAQELSKIICSCDTGCYEAIKEFFEACGLESISKALEDEFDLNCKVNKDGQYCMGASLAIARHPCLSAIATCDTNPSCQQSFAQFIDEHGCCVKEIMDFSLRSFNINFFEVCNLTDPGSCMDVPCPTTTTPVTSMTCPSVTTETSTIVVTETQTTTCPTVTSGQSVADPTNPPTACTPTPTSLPPVPEGPCKRNLTDFVRNRKCSAGVDITRALIFAQPIAPCEYQRFFDRVCKSDTCIKALVALLDICLEENGVDKDNRTAIIENTVVPFYTSLYCRKEPTTKEFCGVLFPEIVNPFTLLNFDISCAFAGENCSSECHKNVKDAVDKYGCCLNAHLKMQYRINPLQVYTRCGITPPKPCRKKLRIEF